jgi:alkylation response protein AidB-like acyl-CoA dehydrogenase
MGLAGTGSKNIVARDAFVPAHRVLAFAELADAAAPGMRANANPVYRQSFLAVLPIAIVSPVLGMAEGALADVLAMAGERTTRGAVAGGNRRMAELTTVQLRLAEASACIDAARLLMFRDLAEAFETAARGEPISMDVRLRNRRDQPLQRAWRDAHGAASHISLNWDSTGSMYGQYMLGLEPKGQF